MQSLECLYESLEYLRATPSLGDVPLPYSRLMRLLAGARLDDLEQRIEHSRYPAKAALRARRKFFTILRSRLGEPAPSVDAQTLAESDIFHSPFFGLPDEVRAVTHVQKFLTIHDVIPVLLPEFFAAEVVGFMRESLRDLQGMGWIITVSESTKRDLLECEPTLDPARVFVVHNAAAAYLQPCTDALQLARVRRKYNIPDAPYLLSLGTIEPRKNLEQLIRCFATLVESERMRDLNLVIVGVKGWLYEKIFEAAHVANAVRRRIYFTGYVADGDLAAIYSGAQAFVYPSLYEGFGLPPLEAMQCGVPVVTSNTSAFPEVIGDAGIMVDPRDADAMCQAMLDVCTDETLRATLSAKSVARARLFSWETATRQTLDAYEVALGRRPQAAD